MPLTEYRSRATTASRVLRRLRHVLRCADCKEHYLGRRPPLTSS